MVFLLLTFEASLNLTFASWFSIQNFFSKYPSQHLLVPINNGNTRAIYSKFTIKKQKRRRRRHPGVFIVELILHTVLVLVTIVNFEETPLGYLANVLLLQN